MGRHSSPVTQPCAGDRATGGTRRCTFYDPSAVHTWGLRRPGNAASGAWLPSCASPVRCASRCGSGARSRSSGGGIGGPSNTSCDSAGTGLYGEAGSAARPGCAARSSAGTSPSLARARGLQAHPRRALGRRLSTHRRRHWRRSRSAWVSLSGGAAIVTRRGVSVEGWSVRGDGFPLGPGGTKTEYGIRWVSTAKFSPNRARASNA